MGASVVYIGTHMGRCKLTWEEIVPAYRQTLESEARVPLHVLPTTQIDTVVRLIMTTIISLFKS